MKKAILIFVALLLVGCTEQVIEVDTLNIKGYWQQIRSEYLGKVEEISYSYLEITDNKLYFYIESSNDKGYYEGVSEKNYILDGNKLYYDYYELSVDNYKSSISEFGGMYEVSFNKEYLVLKKKYGVADQQGYETNTYKKMKQDFRLKDYEEK